MSNHCPDAGMDMFPAEHPLNKCKRFVFDVDGALVRGEGIIPGSSEAIERLTA